MEVAVTSRTDDLRTRIAAVIRSEVPCHPPAADRIADALIAELGLRAEWEGIWEGCGPVTERPMSTREEAESRRRGRSDYHLEHRYVTEWKWETEDE